MPITDPEMPPPTASDGRAGPHHSVSSPNWAEALFASMGISSALGVVVGFVIGGIGGRVAMRILVLTSDESVRGITSDDGFEIGRFSLDTIALLILTSVLGAFAGSAFGFLRMFVIGPTWLAMIGFAITCSALGGAALVQSEGIDFRFLGPLWLAVGLFVAIPGLWGVAMVISCERLLKHPSPIPGLPARITEKRWGLLGWAILVGLTAIGLVDLLDDIATLRR